MISGPEFMLRYRDDEVTGQQVRPGTVRRIWPYLRQYRGPMVLMAGVTAVNSAILVASPLILRLIIDDGILRHRESVVVTLALTSECSPTAGTASPSESAAVGPTGPVPAQLLEHERGFSRSVTSSIGWR